MPILRSFTVMMMRENNFVIQQYINISHSQQMCMCTVSLEIIKQFIYHYNPFFGKRFLNYNK